MATDVEEVKMEPPTADEVLANEDALIAALTKARRDEGAQYALVRVPRIRIPVMSNGRPVIENGEPQTEELSFRVRALHADERQECERKATKKVGGRQFGVLGRAETQTDDTRYQCELIYTATVDEDRARLWDSPAVKRVYNAERYVDVINEMLHAFEMLQVVVAILEVSGVRDEEEAAVSKSARP